MCRSGIRARRWRRALFTLGRLKGVERPAILANIPTDRGFTALIDAGANAECRPAHLQQFAVLGSVYARAFYGLETPSVGLISIGEEEEKGNELTLRGAPAAQNHARRRLLRQRRGRATCSRGRPT